MWTLPGYERDPYGTQLSAEVVRVGEDGGRPFAVLSDTLLYPEGGGQPSDHGFLNDVKVLEVRRVGEEIRHFLAAPVVLGRVKVQLDWSRRFDHMQQHTAQHVLTAVAEDAFGWATTAFHLGEEVSDVELATSSLGLRSQERLEEAVAAHIRAARTITCRRVGLEEFQSLKVRSRGLPEGHSGDIRLVEIAGLDLNTCGGTHLASSAEIEALAILGVESIRGGVRVFYAAGGRLRRRLSAHERRNAALRSLLGTPDAELASGVEGKLEQIRVSERRIRSMEEELAGLLVEAMAARPEAFLAHHFEGKDAGFLQKTARQLLAAAPSKVVFFTAEHQGAAFFLLAAGDSTPVDVASLGQETAAALGGRGGGSGRIFQGKAEHLGARDSVVARLQAVVGCF